MNPIGVNTFVWYSPITDAGVAEAAAKAKRMGFDWLELPVESTSDWDPARAGEVFREHGLKGSICAAMGPGRDLTDPATVGTTSEYVRFCIDALAALGGGPVAGPIYTPVGQTWRQTPSERRTMIGRLIESLKPLSEYAAERGVTLAVEPLNRFETSVLNTAEQAMEVVTGVNHPACGVLLDTFHMNVEEKNQAKAIRLVGDRLYHFHACGCDRGVPGHDHIAWDEIVPALREIGYTGGVVIESFTPDNDTIAKAAAIWRPLAASEDALAQEGLAFLKQAFA